MVKKKKCNSFFNIKKKFFKSINLIGFINKFIPFLWGFIFCLVVLFILSGRKNYLKLYYELREFIDVYDVISNDYYGDINTDNLIGSAIDSMLANIDDQYTTYIDDESGSSFLENVNGTYEGIGCTVFNDESGNIVVMEVFEDSPAFDVGIMKDDIFVKVDDVDLSDKTSTDLSNYVRTSDKAVISLVIKRGDSYIDVELKRKKVEISTVNSEVLDHARGRVGYIKIDVFSSVTYKQFKKELENLEENDILGLVIDVRNNSGGYLSAVSDISSLFLKKDKVIYQLEGQDNTVKILDETKTKRSYPIAVLVNGGSASASEILAAAIKESYKGYVVGTNTYGKGTVQKLMELDNGSMIKYTVQKWLTPEGNYVDEVGITPSLIVSFDSELEYDNQLEEAINLIIQ